MSPLYLAPFLQQLASLIYMKQEAQYIYLNACHSAPSSLSGVWNVYTYKELPNLADNFLKNTEAAGDVKMLQKNAEDDIAHISILDTQDTSNISIISLRAEVDT